MKILLPKTRLAIAICVLEPNGDDCLDFDLHSEFIVKFVVFSNNSVNVHIFISPDDERGEFINVPLFVFLKYFKELKDI